MDVFVTENINRLLDVYKNLLTNYQQEVMELYFIEDWSLKEIAEYYHISRNAVLSTIKRVTKTLNEYEEKLMLLSKFEKINNLVNQLNLAKEEKDELINKIDSIL